MRRFATSALGLLSAVLLLNSASMLLAADQKPAKAVNRKLILSGVAITDRDEITELLGIELTQRDDEHYVVVRIEAEPQTPEGIGISIDDFTLIARNSGDRSGAMSPTEIAGPAVLVLSNGPSGRRGANIGIGNGAPPMGPLGGPPGAGTTRGGALGQAPAGTRPALIIAGVGADANTGENPARVENRAEQSDDPRLAVLKQHILQDADITQTVEGLLYFLMESKEKSKNLGLLYDGEAGRLVIDFN